jgi:NDP-sugar pyrophosphorylase family protein
MTSLLSLLLKNEEIKVVFVNGAWCEVDCNSDVEVYEELLKKGNWSHDWRK